MSTSSHKAKIKIEPRIRYTSGQPAWQGDKVTVNDTAEPAYLRVIGQRGYVTVYHPAWDTARVYHITEISKGHQS